MTPSDTSQTARPRALLRELGLSALLVLGLLSLVELGLRSELAFATLPLARPYYSFDVTRRIHDVDRLVAEHGRIDVLFVGSSVVRAGVDPMQFDRELLAAGDVPVVSYNAGFSRMFSRGAALYLEHVWLPRARPRFVLHGVREAELASQSNPDAHLRHGRIESLWLDDSPASRVVAALLGELRLLQYQGALNTVLARVSAGTPWHVRERGELVTNDRGHRPEKTPLAAKKKARSKRLWRYSHRPSPKRYEAALAAITRMHELCKRAGVTYVLVHMPEHPERFDTKHGPAIYKDYLQRVDAFAGSRGITFVDVSDRKLETFANDKYFSDYHHLRPAGTRRFTKLLARRFAPLYVAAAK